MLTLRRKPASQDGLEHRHIRALQVIDAAAANTPECGCGRCHTCALHTFALQPREAAMTAMTISAARLREADNAIGRMRELHAENDRLQNRLRETTTAAHSHDITKEKVRNLEGQVVELTELLAKDIGADYRAAARNAGNHLARNRVVAALFQGHTAMTRSEIRGTADEGQITLGMINAAANAGLIEQVDTEGPAAFQLCEWVEALIGAAA